MQQLSELNATEIDARLKYQHPSPEKSVIGTVKGLAVEKPQLTPQVSKTSCCLGFQLTVDYLLTTKITSIPGKI